MEELFALYALSLFGLWLIYLAGVRLFMWIGSRREQRSVQRGQQAVEQHTMASLPNALIGEHSFEGTELGYDIEHPGASELLRRLAAHRRAQLDRRAHPTSTLANDRE